jgi:hypothetical protein
VRKTATVGILVIFAGYAIASYGVVLLRGWDITFRSWVDPLHAYVWPSQIPHIPATQVFATPVAAVAAGAGPLGGPGNALSAAGAAAVNAFGGQGG